MKILVFSDSHGHFRGIEKALSLHKDTDFVFFLGDGLREAERISSQAPDILSVYAVRGNCDFFGSDTPYESLVTIEGKRFFLCHGHTKGVKHSLAELRLQAKRDAVDVALFGHTHTPYLTYDSSYEKPFYLMNPGSASPGTDGNGSYGLIQIRKGELLLSHGKC